MRKSIVQIATVIFLASNVCVCGLAQSNGVHKNNPPADWKPVSLGSMTVYVPGDMTEQEKTQPAEKQRIFNNGRLSITISYGLVSLDDLMMIMSAKPELAEEESQIDGKKVHIFTFLMLDKPTPPDPKLLRHRAIAYFPKPLNNDTQNFVMWVECEGAAGQALAKKIFQTAKFQ